MQEYAFLNMKMFGYLNYFNYLLLLKIGIGGIHLYLRRKIITIIHFLIITCPMIK